MTSMEPNTKSFGYKLGHMFAGVVMICLSALALAVTAKIIHWMLF